MAKKPQPPGKGKQDKAADRSVAEKSKAARTLLIAAALVCLVSLGGGFFLARIAFENDATNFELDYVSDEGEFDDPSQNSGAGESMQRASHGQPEAGHASNAEKYREAAVAEDATPPAEKTVLLEFNELITNISSLDSEGVPTQSFLKVSLSVVYRAGHDSSDIMKERQPFMRDLFNGYLRGLTEADVRGMAGVLHVKAQLLKRARAAVGSDLPQEILISELIVQ